jgi:PAS domain S-box-containing protein
MPVESALVEPLEAPLPRPRVLLVDDRPGNLLALEAVLEPLHLQLVRANSGEEALRHLLQGEFAAILLDVQMPDLDGFETAMLIKSRDKNQGVPILFITAINREMSHIFEGYRCGAVDYLTKPIDPAVLRSKVRVFVELYEQRERLKQQQELLRLREREALEQQNAARYRALADLMPQCMWATDAQGTLTQVNRSWREFSGMSDAETASEGVWSRLHPADQGVRLAWKEALARGERFEAQYRLRRADGEYRWHLGRAVPEWANGQLVGFVATSTDIHDQKQVERELLDFRTTLDATQDGVFIFDAESLQLRYVNQGAVVQLGYPREALLERSLADFQPELDETAFRAVLDPLRGSQARSHTYVTSFRKRDGFLFPVEVVVQFIATEAGVGRFVAVVRDITERQNALSALRLVAAGRAESA